MANSNRELTAALAVSLATSIPLYIEGEPGVGKSALVEHVASSSGYFLFQLIGSARLSEDMIGIPYLHQNPDGSKEMRFAPTDFMVVAQRWAADPTFQAQYPRGVLLFFDELTTVKSDVQAPMLQIIQMKRVNGVPLGDHVSIITAGNKVEHAAAGQPLTMPMANRLVHYEHEVDVDEWVRAKLTGEWPVHPVPVLTDWADSVPTTGALFASFIQAKRSALQRAPTDDEKQSDAWPSARTWEYGINLWAACDRLEEEALRSRLQPRLLRGLVGEGASTEFLTWKRNLDLPDPEEVLKNPDALVLPKRGDLAMAVINNTVSYVLSGRNTPENWTKCWKILAKAYHMKNQDIAAVAARTLGLKRPKDAIVPKEIMLFTSLFERAGIKAYQKVP